MQRLCQDWLLVPDRKIACSDPTGIRHKRFDHLILVFNSSYRTPSFVILYCFVSPLILLIRNTQAKTSLVNLADAIVCLTLSCGHPFAAVTIQLVEYILLNPNLGNDNLWSTQTILLTPQLVPSTKIHLATMLALHVGTYLALRRVSESVHHISAALSSMSVKSMSSLFRSRSVRIFQALRLRATNADGKSSHGKHVNLAHEKRIHLQVNLILNFVVGGRRGCCDGTGYRQSHTVSAVLPCQRSAALRSVLPLRQCRCQLCGLWHH
ncbi:hypothetical protein DYB32_004981 [Aphanomyces invadans]|uniref:Uncharacterized protein n=1 Tax=Aphanomyces invadans TaxID=157072 RepID=A0A3R6ZQ95_9STRA|nr:hypothetical protein DYB32_004981 [Aphanomyces invadans]